MTSERLNPLQWIGVKLLRFYQLAISPWLGPSCKYYPTCSSYALEAIQLHGFFRGVGLGVWRILRCNPWSRGGVDFPPGSTREVPIPPDEPDADVEPVTHGHPHSHLHTSNGKRNTSWT